ncbi:ABC transporter substrate-binding protein [Microbacterium sp. NPDC096154]|uniref:ABC transporter substrate-binding protein n=1 Tax=Microbacterium sp. NPDC096154 TaxID=3155549 RepID=UPI003327C986
MQRKIRIPLTLAPLALTGLLLAGCTGGATNTDPDGGESPAAADATLRINYGEFPENWAPGQEMEGGLLRVPYETLLAPGADGTPQPFLATDYELTDEAITLTLRDGVTFHDGTPLDAEAVKANVEYVKAGATPAAGVLQSIESVDVVDDLTVRFNLAGPNPAIAHTLTTRTLPIASPASLADDSAAQHPVGTSPWAYSPDTSVTGTRLAFTAFEDYWGDAPGFANIELYAIAEPEAAAAALLNGEIDVTEVEPTVLPRFEGSAIEHIQFPAIRNNVIFFDRGPGGVFESQELRQAVCSAIDVAQFGEISGEHEAAAQHFDEGEIGYSADIAGYGGDLDEAKTLYSDAGSPSVSMELIAAPYNAHQLEVYVEQFSQIGDISATVSTVPPPQFGGEWNSGRYPMGLGSNDEATPFEWYNSWFAADAPGNPSGVESEALKRAADAAIAAGGSEEAAELWGEAMKVVSDEALTCAHARGLETIAWNPEVVEGIAQPAELWEPKLINYRDVTPAS